MNTSGFLVVIQNKHRIPLPENRSGNRILFLLLFGLLILAKTPAIHCLTEATAEQLEGFWPELSQTTEDASQNSPDIRSIAERLHRGDPRAQCFDYAALSVALLRSIGLPARAITVINPQRMKHPRERNREIFWNFHVWTEVHMENKWWGFDATYLDDDFKEQPEQNAAPGALQPSTGPWFVQMIGPDSKVWLQAGRRIIEVTSDYRRVTGHR